MKKLTLILILLSTFFIGYSQTEYAKKLHANFTQYPAGRRDAQAILANVQYGHYFTKRIEAGLGLGYGISYKKAWYLNTPILQSSPLRNINFISYTAYSNFHLLPKLNFLDFYVGARLGGLYRFTPKNHFPFNQSFFDIEANIGATLFIWEKLGINVEHGFSNRFKAENNDADKIRVWRIGITKRF